MSRLALTCAIVALVIGGTHTPAADPQPQPQQPQPSKFEQVTKGLTRRDHGGDEMWVMYHNDQQLLVELDGGDLQQEYIILTSIARGIGSGMVIGGMSWNFEDDAIWTFRKSGEKIYVLRRNVRFRATPNSPEASAVELAYSDSVLYVLPIITKAPSGADLVDMTRIFMSDDQQIGLALGGGPRFAFSSDRSTWSKVNAHKGNVQLQVAAVYSGSGTIEKVPDARGVQVNVHYSISTLPPLGRYRPRIADDRVGYFLTVIKDFSDKDDDQHFVRLITRWDLQKHDPQIALSTPREPIEFYIEKTVPVFLRPTVEAGILEWNKAFEKIGFSNAIRVQYEEDVEKKYNISIDPEDVNYNFFRWITSEAGYALGPSRIDPRTGEILDADILFDASFLDTWKQKYETLTAEEAHRLTPNWSPLDDLLNDLTPDRRTDLRALCAYGHQMQHDLGFATAILLGRGAVAKPGELPLELVQQGIKEIVMHEVGHTLGLKHNFKASTWKTVAELANLDKVRSEGMVGSVMDYAPANIARTKAEQGLYYTSTIGPYDYWAIEYGYKPISGDEKAELAKIAARSGEPGLAFATDEDTRPFDPDPFSNMNDLGQDPLNFVRRQLQHTNDMLPTLVNSAVRDGEAYQRARQAFGLLLKEHWRALMLATRFPGGVEVNRNHKSADATKPPFQVIDPALQREAMQLVIAQGFAPPKYDGAMFNYLAPTHWSHWGIDTAFRTDFPIHSEVELYQSLALGQLLTPTLLSRLLDNEYKIPVDQDAYTLAEHLRLLVDGVFTECLAGDAQGEFTARKPYVQSFRRNLQREGLRRLALLVTHGAGAPPDARTLARQHLSRLDASLAMLLEKPGLTLDDYSRAHVTDSRDRIRQALNAEVTAPAVN
ncbi:MAG: zinc-dependent metalloprotease [Planctomycetaceae bacterium]